ncbi:helix-turn-helix domain-containing protein [Aquincola sp. S2]|uniref:Helix-turn-helix domain-containing protein n=1 Tax=Pseudaquabacterium terrae TaxID=2732868 RepID=A0ABX2EHU5_9BURK|nr:helix-turn-helix domain-containing protein [Aquabacterium terrae]NRF68183.1 helix-turn-helix domain-containing protein [Aquabacterium terrae]
MKTVWILVPDGVMDSSLAITLDVLRTAQAIAARTRGVGQFQFRVLGARAQVRTGCGLRLRTDATFRQAEREGATPQWVIVPALGEYGARLAAHLSQPDALQAQRLLRALAARKLRSLRIGASCASVFLLAEAGLLAQRSATTTWWLAADFRARYPDVILDERRMVVPDGPLVTAGSAFSQLDLMLAVLGDLVGVRIADLCARYLLIDRRPSQARYMIAAHAQQHDPVIGAAERWIDEHLTEPMTVRALAQAAAMSEKTFSRRVQAATGLSPIRLIQRRRLMMATHLIETTKTPIEQVAAQVGYRDSTTLRRLIRRDLDTSPSGLR